jgi:hypothetical protein
MNASLRELELLIGLNDRELHTLGETRLLSGKTVYHHAYPPYGRRDIPVDSYLRSLKSTYQQQQVKRDLHTANSALLERKESFPRKINIKNLPVAEKVKRSGNALKELKEVYKLE